MMTNRSPIATLITSPRRGDYTRSAKPFVAVLRFPDAYGVKVRGRAYTLSHRAEASGFSRDPREYGGTGSTGELR